MSINLADFKQFLSKQVKHGSVILALIIPVVLLLSQFKLVSKDFMSLLTQIILAIETILVIVRIAFDEFLKAKVKLTEVNNDLHAGKPQEAKTKIKNNITELVDTSKEVAKDLIDHIKKPTVISPKIAEIENNTENVITSSRNEVITSTR